MNIKFILVLILMSIIQNSYSTTTYGNESTCEYNMNDYTLQEVINLQGFNTEIRITSDVEIFENLEITQSVRLVGGFANCEDANNNILSNKTMINGSGVKPVIAIMTQDTSHVVRIENFKLVNGKGISSSQGGGISITNPGSNTGTVGVTLRNSIVSNNLGINGGGIYISDSNNNLHLFNSIILNNESTNNGGGIYCTGSKINIDEESGISLNSVYNIDPNAGHGGGIYASENCQVTIKASKGDGFGGFRGIFANSSSGHGGGIYAQSQSIIDIFNPNHAVNINDNFSDSDGSFSGAGGAVFLTGTGTNVVVSGSEITNNQAYNGGAFAIENDATLTIGFPENNIQCWNSKKCNSIESNKSKANGGAFYLYNGNMDASYGYINGHRAGLGTVIYSDSGSNINLQNLIIHNNGNGGDADYNDIYTYRFFDSIVSMINVTSADNHTQGTIYRQHTGSYLLTHTIFDEPDSNLMADFTSNVGIADCLVVSTDNGFENLTSSIVARPHFIDSENNDYHLAKFSVGIDRCPYSPLLNSKDIDNEFNTWDDPTMNNINGYNDAGADESYVSDIVFTHNFE